jgi:hypothetical protein
LPFLHYTQVSVSISRAPGVPERTDRRKILIVRPRIDSF